MKKFTVYYSVGNSSTVHSVEVDAETELDALQQVEAVLRLNGESFAISLKP